VEARDADDGAARSQEVREGVRDGILAALEREDRRSGAWAARRLAAAGALGVAAAVALTLLFSGDATGGHEHRWHLALCGAAWAGLLVESFAFALLRIRTRRLALGQAAALGLVGLALAALIGIFCPEPHYLAWWQSTALGGWTWSAAGPRASALCFGFCSSLLVGLGASLVLALRGGRPERVLLPALGLWLLLFPAVILQTLAAPVGIFVSWSAGTAAGALLGVSAGRELAS
jgi:hypothetical protein